jgi:5'(3')-deoxyribonucleotidase
MTTIFLDMDGVVADFDSYAKKILGYSTSGGKRYPPEDWAKISANPRFYYELDICPWANQLVSAVQEVAVLHDYDIKFLTAIPRANDVPWCFTDKVLWAQQRWPTIPVWFGPYSHDKHVHCRSGDILIDDRNDNINAWNLAGGLGILHQGNVDATLEKLYSLM